LVPLLLLLTLLQLLARETTFSHSQLYPHSNNVTLCRVHCCRIQFWPSMLQ
jgi:hypothetical protein